MSVTYSSYLKLDELLSLQQPTRGSEGREEHDEMLFIVIHQVYELWFKQILHELDRLLALLGETAPERDTVPDALFTLRRILTILKTMVAQIDVLETMTPVNFLSFRDRLESASGFQSPQFREVEYLLGVRHRHMLVPHRDNEPAYRRLVARLGEPSLWQVFLAYLRKEGYEQIPEEATRAADEIPEGPEIRRALTEIYRSDNHHLTQVCERLVDLDEGLQEWRYRHVKMVERTIGNKRGTGGSAGTDYLKKSLFRSIFPDLWNIRTEL